MEEKIMTLHPAGKSGVNISKQKYDTIRLAIEKALDARREMTFSDLLEAVRQQLDGRFDGSINWYFTTVKLDLEARQIIKRIPGQTPQRLCLVDRS